MIAQLSASSETMQEFAIIFDGASIHEYRRDRTFSKHRYASVPFIRTKSQSEAPDMFTTDSDALHLLVERLTGDDWHRQLFFQLLIDNRFGGAEGPYTSPELLSRIWPHLRTYLLVTAERDLTGRDDTPIHFEGSRYPLDKMVRYTGSTLQGIMHDYAMELRQYAARFSQLVPHRSLV